MVPLAPTFTAATAKTPVPVAPAILTVPGKALGKVAANATTSGTGVGEAERRIVLTPTRLGTGLPVFAQSKIRATSVLSKGCVGVKAKTKLWNAPAGMSTGVFSVPVT